MWLSSQTEEAAKQGLGQGGDQEPNNHSNEASEVLLGELSGKMTISAALHLSDINGKVARRKSVLNKRYLIVVLEFAKQLLKDSKSIRNNHLWSDETNIELFANAIPWWSLVL